MTRFKGLDASQQLKLCRCDENEAPVEPNARRLRVINSKVRAPCNRKEEHPLFHHEAFRNPAEQRGCDSPPYPTDELSCYSRRQAIADGVLVDVSREASPAGMLGGFAVPVAVTAALWTTIETIPNSLAGIADPRGRLHDMLWMAALAARRNRGTDRAPFLVHLPSRGTRKRTRELLLHVGPGDRGEPVATIGFPEDF